MNLAFERPVLAIAAILSPFVLALARRITRSAFNINISLGPPGGKAFSPDFRFRVFVNIKHILETIGVFALLIAAADPIIIKKEIMWMNRGADIMFVLDCSPSMSSIDMKDQNRFNASRSLIGAFAANRPADAIGLVAFGIQAAMLIPPTVDHRALLQRLETLQIGELGDGTAIGMALALAAMHLQNSVANQKAVVLITDGENNAGSVHPLQAASALYAQGVSLYVIGVGSSGTVPIDYIDPVTRIRRTGDFESKFNDENLKTLADAAHGVFIQAPSIESFQSAFKTINNKEANISRSLNRTSKVSVHEPVLLFALAVLCAALLYRNYILGAFL